MPPGKYTFDLVAVDRGRDRTFEVSRVVTIPAYAAPGLMLSDMLVSNSVPLTDAEGQFVREGFRIIPSPDRAFGASGPMLYVYQEVYNLSPSSALSDSFSLTYRIVDRSGQEARSFSTKGKSGGESRVIKISGLSLVGIPPGRYDLVARVEDPVTGLRTSCRRDILIVAARRAGDASASELSDEQMLMSRDLLVYLASSREKALFESLDEAGKDNFIRRFWIQRDPERSAAGNPYLQEMTRRYEYVNDHYSGHNPGWRTDRGRVYITYGPPKELERNISNPGTRDHEIWTYAIEGQGKFIFVDERGYGDYRLVHSTVRGEVENPAWEELLELIDDQR
jgi:GWxTD domain-containing protein